MKITTAKEAIEHIRSGQRIFVHGGAATPHTLLDALYERRDFLSDIELIHIHIEGDVPHTRKDFAKAFRSSNLFIGANIRGHINYKENDYLPIFLSEIPSLFQKKRKIDVALIHVSQKGPTGLYSLGTSVDVAKAAIQTAGLVIAQINPHMPYVFGDGCIKPEDIDLAVEVNTPLIESKELLMTDEERAIGQNIASLIEDGSTLQIGIGKIPSAVALCLNGHRDLGVHTEIWSDSLLPLIHSGVINNRCKVIHPGKMVSTFLIGTKKLYDFIHNNEEILNLEVSFTNNPEVIGKNPKVVAINSAVEIDLTGQVCADSIGTKIISGVGGQIDFMHGAKLSHGGKSIIAMQSMTESGRSKIVALLQPGAGVVSTRAHIHYVVTEYGIADLYGLTLGERAKALIAIAHPSMREMLEKQWKDRS